MVKPETRVHPNVNATVDLEPMPSLQHFNSQIDELQMLSDAMMGLMTRLDAWDERTDNLLKAKAAAKKKNQAAYQLAMDIFSMIDTNNDGALSREEWNTAFKKVAENAKGAVAQVRLDKDKESEKSHCKSERPPRGQKPKFTGMPATPKALPAPEAKVFETGVWAAMSVSTDNISAAASAILVPRDSGSRTTPDHSFVPPAQPTPEHSFVPPVGASTTSGQCGPSSSPYGPSSDGSARAQTMPCWVPSPRGSPITSPVASMKTLPPRPQMSPKVQKCLENAIFFSARSSTS